MPDETERIAEIKGRLATITADPWRAGDGSEATWYLGKDVVVADTRLVVQRATYHDDTFDNQTYADIEFIAHAPDDMRWTLEALADRDTKISSLESRLAETKRTLEAAIEDLNTNPDCGVCKYTDDDRTPCSLFMNGDCRFEWRGV